MTEQQTGEADILNELVDMVRTVIGEEWIQSFAIERNSKFSQDLELESIEIVALAEKVQERWGEEVDFPGWLAEMDVDQIIALSVGQLVDRIVARSAGA